jgi:hypothetical protein
MPLTCPNCGKAFEVEGRDGSVSPSVSSASVPAGMMGSVHPGLGEPDEVAEVLGKVPALRVHKVGMGETPMQIAEKYTGDRARVGELLAANPQKPVAVVHGRQTFQSLTPDEELRVPHTWMASEAPGFGAAAPRGGTIVGGKRWPWHGCAPLPQGWSWATPISIPPAVTQQVVAFYQDCHTYGVRPGTDACIIMNQRDTWRLLYTGSGASAYLAVRAGAGATGGDGGGGGGGGGAPDGGVPTTQHPIAFTGSPGMGASGQFQPSASDILVCYGQGVHDTNPMQFQLTPNCAPGAVNPLILGMIRTGGWAAAAGFPGITSGVWQGFYQYAPGDGYLWTMTGAIVAEPGPFGVVSGNVVVYKRPITQNVPLQLAPNTTEVPWTQAMASWAWIDPAQPVDAWVTQQANYYKVASRTTALVVRHIIPGYFLFTKDATGNVMVKYYLPPPLPPPPGGPGPGGGGGAPDTGGRQTPHSTKYT